KSNKLSVVLSLLVFIFTNPGKTIAQTNYENITIARDSFGVPHIFGKTDAEVAYGLAWAHCEDDFKDVQENLLAGKAMLGRVEGKEGVLFDFAVQFFGIDTFVDSHYSTDLSADFRNVLEAYVQGVNDFAAKHPEEVLVKKALPFCGKDVIKGYTLNLTLFAGAGIALKSIKENRVQFFFQPNERGSNAMAISGQRTEDGKTWLAVNSHQPIEGRFAWYEAHLCSEEGLDVIGGLFPGGVSVFVGTNRHLGWAHTTNYHNFGDIYKLTHRGGKYLYDGQWKKFTQRTAHLKIRIGKLVLPVSKKLFNCEYGPVFKTRHGWYALRFPGYMDIRAGEQWYRMDKAANWQQFDKAIHMQAIPLFNIVYADCDGNIFWQSGCQIPLRDTTLNWSLPINGISSKYKWTQLLPFNQKPALFNPGCGYVYSCNQTPLHTSGPACNWQGYFTGMQLFNYNRGERFGEMLDSIKGKFTWQDFRRIKFDKTYSANGSYARNFKALYNLDPLKYPNLADAIAKIKHWNWRGDADNTDAPLAMLTHERLMKELNGPFAFLMIKQQPLTETEAADALLWAKTFLLKTHGSINIPLGDLQRHIRGNVNLPASGLREVPRACDTKLYDKKKGIFRFTGGDGYIQLVKYGKDGVDLQTINAYGASARPNSPHYTDQMAMFEKEQLKPMTFDKALILKNAERIYHPGY
ncbi:MAG TPA: penicillin acylase family protein, partial [Chitinophagales bacterium]|nr:penicillin acylase family protein [Chitinophagales bacterium]